MNTCIDIQYMETGIHAGLFAHPGMQIGLYADAGM